MCGHGGTQQRHGFTIGSTQKNHLNDLRAYLYASCIAYMVNINSWVMSDVASDVLSALIVLFFPGSFHSYMDTHTPAILHAIPVTYIYVL